MKHNIVGYTYVEDTFADDADIDVGLRPAESAVVREANDFERDLLRMDRGQHVIVVLHADNTRAVYPANMIDINSITYRDMTRFLDRDRPDD